MRHLTESGWARVMEGLALEDHFASEADLWAWAKDQGSGFRLAVAFILGMLGADPWDFDGLNDELAQVRPVRLAFSMDETRRALVADFLLEPRAYVRD